jgi:hypothetical protein
MVDAEDLAAAVAMELIAAGAEHLATSRAGMDFEEDVFGVAHVGDFELAAAGRDQGLDLREDAGIVHADSGDGVIWIWWHLVFAATLGLEAERTLIGYKSPDSVQDGQHDRISVKVQRGGDTPRFSLFTARDVGRRRSSGDRREQSLPTATRPPYPVGL